MMDRSPATEGRVFSTRPSSLARTVSKRLTTSVALMMVALLSLCTGTTTAHAAVKLTSTLQVTQTGPGEVLVSWAHRPLSPTAQTLLVEVCKTSCSTSKAKFAKFRRVTLEPFVTRTAISGLQARSTYRFTLSATAGSSKSTVTKKLLLTAVPSALRDVRVAWEGPDLVVVWDGAPAGMTIAVLVTRSDGTQLIRSVPSSPNMLRIPGLDDTKRYNLSVTPSTAAGMGPSTTKEIAPPLPTVDTVTASRSSATSAQVTWSGTRASSWKLSIVSPGSARNGVTLTLAGLSTTTSVTGLTSGATYAFRLVGVNTQGTGEPVTSDPVIIRPETVVAGAPTELAALSGDGAVDLRWTAPNGPVSSYRVMYRHSTTSVWSSALTTTSTTATVNGLTNGDSYLFRVESISSDGTSTPSDEVLATPTAVTNEPDPSTTGGGTDGSTSTETDLSNTDTASTDQLGDVAGLEVSAGDGIITVLWGAAPRGATMEWLRSGSTTWTAVTNPSNPIILRNLVNGVPYTIRFVDVTGALISAMVDATPTGTPTGPTNVMVTAGDAEISVSWEAPASDGGHPISGYPLVLNGVNGTAQAFVAADAQLTYTFTGLINGQEYTIGLAAMNALGSSFTVTNISTPVAT